MRSRFNLFSASSIALATIAGFLSVAISPVDAQIVCSPSGPDTFRIGSTLKFFWNDTQDQSIDTFYIDLYCVQNNRLVATIDTLNLTSPSPVTWIADSSLTTAAADCTYNQFQGGFRWTYPDFETGATTNGINKCKVMLLVGTGSQASPTAGSEDPLYPDDPDPSTVVVTDKTKNILIGVGCAVGVLILAGFIGFYVIRYGNKRAAEAESSKKLREPLHAGPLFPPNNNPRTSRYNELASVTGSSSPASRTEMAEMGNSGASYVSASPALGSRSPTPIALAHSKLSIPASNLSNSQSFNERPGSLLTSSFIPADDSRPSTPHRNPFDHNSQQYEHE
ncbi:hypothetical protein BGZ76_004488, partial [Entomortierella beljakovae]